MLGNAESNFRLNNHIPILYKKIHSRIVLRKGKRLKSIPKNFTEIDRHDLCLFLSDCGVSKNIVDEFLKEMESYGLVRIKNKRSVEIK